MLNVFCAYAREDDPDRKRLVETFFAPLVRQQLIRTWYDRQIAPGADWNREIAANQLDNSDIIMLLVSDDFVASDYVVGDEVPRAMQRHKDGSATVIPVLLSAANMTGAPFADLQALPSTGEAVADWGDGSRLAKDRAMRDIASGFERVALQLAGLEEYPPAVRHAMLARYGELERADIAEHLGRPARPNPCDGKEFKSRRGTRGYVWPFTSGAGIYWTEQGGGHPVWGAIGHRYRRLGGPDGRLGFPLSPESDTASVEAGRHQRFEETWDAWTVDDLTFGATIYLRSAEGRASPTWGGIGVEYERLGGTDGVLGFPTSFEVDRSSPQGTDGVRQNFQGGAIYYRGDEHDCVAVTEPILAVYRRYGGVGRQFGFPLTRAQEDQDTHLQEFEGGLIWVRATSSD